MQGIKEHLKWSFESISSWWT